MTTFEKIRQHKVNENMEALYAVRTDATKMVQETEDASCYGIADGKINSWSIGWSHRAINEALIENEEEFTIFAQFDCTGVYAVDEEGFHPIAINGTNYIEEASDFYKNFGDRYDAVIVAKAEYLNEGGYVIAYEPSWKNGAFVG